MRSLRRQGRRMMWLLFVGVALGVGLTEFSGRGPGPGILAQGTAGLSGVPRVMDGDTLDLRGTRIRLYGIDAPESAQQCRAAGRVWACGQQATRALVQRIRGRTVSCTERDRDRYGRVVAICRGGDEDLNAWMVAEGWALAYRRYSRQYVGQEQAAKAARRGIWRGEMVPPWAWRRGQRLAGEGNERRPTGPSDERQPGCVIKGNINSTGTRIYHVPGDRYYDQTRINAATGERWFCSGAEARKAGWRRARQ